MSPSRRNYMASITRAGLGIITQPIAGEILGEIIGKSGQIRGIEAIKHFDGNKRLSESATDILDNVGCKEGRSQFCVGYVLKDGGGIQIEYGDGIK